MKSLCNIEHLYVAAFLCLVGTIPIHAGDGMESSRTVDQVRKAISTGGLWEGDLNFKKNVVADPNMPAFVQTLLSQPLSQFEFSERVENELRLPPWEWVDGKTSNQKLDLKTVKDIPIECRELIENLLGNVLRWKEAVCGKWDQISLEERKEALRCAAFGTFHMEEDAGSVKEWELRLDEKKGFSRMVDKANHFKISGRDLLGAQMKVGRFFQPAEMKDQAAGLLVAIHQFVEEIKPVVKDHPELFRFNRVEFDTPMGSIILGGTGPQHYGSKEAVVIIDFGGDDVYEGAGSALGTTGSSFSLVVDLAGHDTYQSAGSGIWGAGMVWDEAGRDVYRTGDAALACGMFGMGVVVDREGDDRYEGGTFSQGAGLLGLGMLWDGGGNDHYSVRLTGQGYGDVRGMGILVDTGGDDVYFAGGKYPDYDRLPGHFLSLSQGFGMGARPFVAGGLGILCDQGGNDRYECDVFGQGSAYWYSCGMLLDGGGNDVYKACQYDQGTGIHLSAGILKDAGGDDVYESERGLAQAGCHDLAVGLLWDGAGNDSYSADSASQGSGIYNAVGILYDGNGDDRYTITHPERGTGQGKGEFTPVRGMGSVGVFLDLHGKDVYSGGNENDRFSTQLELGVTVDAADEKMLDEWKRPWMEGDVPSKPGEGGLFEDTRFSWGRWVSDRPAGEPRTEEEMVRHGGDPAMGEWLREAGRSGDAEWKTRQRRIFREKLNGLPVQRYEALFPFLAREDPMTRQVVEELISTKKSPVLPMLRLGCANPWWEIRTSCVRWLGELGMVSDAGHVIKSLEDPKTRVPALVALNRLKPEGYGEKVGRYLSDPRAMVRGNAARFMRKGGDVGEEKWLELLEDEDWNVRVEAAQALVEAGYDPGSGEDGKGKILTPLGRYWMEKVRKEKGERQK